MSSAALSLCTDSTFCGGEEIHILIAVHCGSEMGLMTYVS